MSTAQIIVPVLPLPPLQWRATTLQVRWSVSPQNCRFKLKLPLSSLLASSQPSTDVLYQLDHLLETWHVVVVNLVPPDVAMELPVVILHLTT